MSGGMGGGMSGSMGMNKPLRMGPSSGGWNPGFQPGSGVRGNFSQVGDGANMGMDQMLAMRNAANGAGSGQPYDPSGQRNRFDALMGGGTDPYSSSMRLGAGAMPSAPYNDMMIPPTQTFRPQTGGIDPGGMMRPPTHTPVGSIQKNPPMSAPFMSRPMTGGVDPRDFTPPPPQQAAQPFQRGPYNFDFQGALQRAGMGTPPTGNGIVLAEGHSPTQPPVTPPPGQPQRPTIPPRPTGPMQLGQTDWMLDGGFGGGPQSWRPTFSPEATQWMQRQMMGAQRQRPDGSMYTDMGVRAPWVDQLDPSNLLGSIGLFTGNRFGG